MSTFIALSMLVMFLFVAFVKLQQNSRLSYINAYRFHPAIKAKLKRKYPDLGDTELDLVFQGLRDYFFICNKAQKQMVSMPSQIVDDAWHEFILFTRSYQQFCQKALGRFLHHTPAEAMATPTFAQDGIKRAWRLACMKEGINPKAPTRLPMLFSLDKQLAIAGGFTYNLDCLLAGNQSFCASHIGCGGGCSGGCGGDSSSDGGDGCGGGCGGGD